MDWLLKHANTYIDVACVVAWLANVCLFFFAYSEGYRDLQLLSLLNMFLLSFRVLRDTNAN